MPSSRRTSRRRFGQNFLVNESAIARIVGALRLTERDPVLEIGPGRGALTRALVRGSRRVAAIEIDRDLIAELRRAAPLSGLRLLEGDVLELTCDRVGEALELDRGERVVVTGNLPYNISKPIAMKLVDTATHVARAVLMFQSEVAARLTSRPNRRTYGPLGILVGSAYRVETLFELSPGSFRPRPSVRSAVTAWEPRSELPDRAHRDRLRACLRACFHARRRTILNSARARTGWPDADVQALLERAGIDPKARAEAVPPEGFERLAAVWPVPGPSGPA